MADTKHPPIPWNYDMEAAKTQGNVLICADDGEGVPLEKREYWVGWSHWVEYEKEKDKHLERWCNIATTQKAICWVKILHVHAGESSDE